MRRLKYAALESGSKLDRKPDNQSYLGLENIESGTGKVLLEDGQDEVESTVIDFQEGDILFGKLRPYLAKVVHADFDGVGTTELLVLRPKSDVDGHFLFYHLLADGFIDKVNSLTYGAKMPRANSTQVGNLLVGLPPLSEQHAIAAFLDRETARIDALIRKQERLIDLLEEKRAALISHTVTKGLDPDVEMKDSGIEWLEEIPAHWGITRVWTLFELGRGRVISAEEVQDNPGPYPVYSSQTAGQGAFGYIDTFDFEGIYLTWTTDGANAGTVFYREGKFNCTNVCGTLKATAKDVEPKFFAYALNTATSFFVRHDINPKLMNNVMARIKVQVPPPSEQCAIAAYLDRETARIDALIGKAEAMIERLQEYRTALISAAVTGKIDVRREV
jgi:type I restriction enzyme S subunit